MGIGLALITKAVMAKRVVKNLPKISVFACKECSTIAAVKFYKDRVEVVRCNCP